VCGGRDNVRVIERIGGRDAGRHEAADVRHVGQQVGAVLIGNLRPPRAVSARCLARTSHSLAPRTERIRA